MGKREENKILGYDDSQIIHFFKCMKPQKKILYLSNHNKMCEILGLGLGFFSCIGWYQKPLI
jgi:hypothetical protein